MRRILFPALGVVGLLCAYAGSSSPRGRRPRPGLLPKTRWRCLKWATRPRCSSTPRRLKSSSSPVLRGPCQAAPADQQARATGGVGRAGGRQGPRRRAQGRPPARRGARRPARPDAGPTGAKRGACESQSEVDALKSTGSALTQEEAPELFELQALYNRPLSSWNSWTAPSWTR